MPRKKRRGRRELTPAELLLAGIGPSPAKARRALGAKRADRLLADWRAWDEAHGLRWRLENECPHSGDLAELYRRAEGLEPARWDRHHLRPDPRLSRNGKPDLLAPEVELPSTVALRAQLETLIEKNADLFEGPAAPDPPGFDLPELEGSNATA